MNLRIPGPTPCPPQVLEACAGLMIDHRGPQFAQLLSRVTEGLKQLFQTENDVLILTTSGTGAMEAAVVNTLSPGDRVLAVSIGEFGHRFTRIAEVYGAEVVQLTFPHGQAADPVALEEALADAPDVKAVLITHNETSTGVTNDLKALAKVARHHDKLILVDAVSSLGAIPCPVDEWDLDVVCTASQKGWMVPPGLAMVSVGPRAWEAYSHARMPRFYFDFAKARDFAKDGQTPWTPAISMFYAFDVALEMLLSEGIESIFARHQRIGQMVRDGVKELGLGLAADERFASNTVTAVKVPEGLEVGKLRRLMEEEHEVVMAGGQGPMRGKVFRIGHLGLVNDKDIQHVLEALGQVLDKLGFHAGKAQHSRVD